MSATTMPYLFDGRGIAKRFRHAAIFGALESLGEGETMRFVNDHDPLPLLDSIARRYGGQIVATYVERNSERTVIDFAVQPIAQAYSPAEQCGAGGGCACASHDRH